MKLSKKRKAELKRHGENLLVIALVLAATTVYVELVSFVVRAVLGK